jgi:hypothetical protein
MPTDLPLPPRPARDPRLDFFRGLGLFIIFVAHVPANPWNNWILGRFGFSDATEIFVFCSGIAAALALGRLYDSAGFALATARVVQRAWQVYRAHVAVLVAGLALVLIADRLLGGDGHVIDASPFRQLIGPDVGAGLLGYLTLTYQPDYFDILPMYVVMLLLLPLVMALSRVSPIAPVLCVVGLYAIGTTGHLALPADPWSGRRWFFHPLAWQLVFFLGFAFGRDWFKPPPYNPRLVRIAAGVVLVALPLAWWPLRDLSPTLTTAYHGLGALIDKTDLGPLRFVHFLALAYLAYVAAGPRGARIGGRVADLVCLVGRHGLEAFMASILLSMTGGIVLDAVGRDASSVLAVNLAGFAGLVVVAYAARWLKAKPWMAPAAATRPKGPAAHPVAPASRVPTVPAE